MIRGFATRLISDFRAFGPGVVGYRLLRFSKNKRRRIYLRGIGDISLRYGNSDFDCFRQVWGNQEYSLKAIPAVESRIRALYEKLVAEGETPVILDAGANVGAASLWFASVFPEAKIIAVEPDPSNFAVLVDNVRAVDSVVPVCAAIGSEPGFVTLTSPESGWAVQSSRSTQGTQVITVDDAVSASGAGTLFIVKIDIEGFEKDLFAANTGWIKSAYAIFIEPHDWMLPGEFTSTSFLKALGTGDFEMFILGENIAFVRK